jgi:predicted phosphodiesterase
VRFGVISDIHANLPALEAALEALGRERLDGYICPGDLVGYGPHPNEVVALVRSLDPCCVAGNHDLMALGRLSTDRADALARTTIAWTRERLEDDARAYLEALPAVAGAADGAVAVAHGTLADPSDYVRTPDQATGALTALASELPAAELLLLGHTHTAAAYGERSGPLRRDRAGTVRPADGERWLVNAGSVGQPREWRRVVRFAVLDLDRRVATLHAIGYDHRRTARDLAAAGLPARALHRRPRLRSKLKRAVLSGPRRRSRR